MTCPRLRTAGRAGLVTMTTLALAATASPAFTAGPGHRSQHRGDHASHGRTHQSSRGSGRYNTKTPTSTGFGGAVSSVDPEASRVGLRVLRHGGNAVDAAIATAGALGVTEPFSSGIGGGGYFVYYDADTGQVHTVDGRETAPAAMSHDAFIDPATHQPYPFTPQRVTSGVSVGVPGTLATWQRALTQWGSRSLRRSLRPAEHLARRGFTVDQTFHDQVVENEQRFRAYTTTPQVYLPGGHAPTVGSVFRNKALARTYRLIGKRGTGVFYDGPIADEITQQVQHPPVSDDTDLPVPPGSMTPQDLANYRALLQDPTQADFRGYDVYGMAGAAAGGGPGGGMHDNGEGLEPAASADDVQQLHDYLEASALAFADRGEYVGDTAYVDVPLRDLLSDEFADERACQVDPDNAATKPVAAGDVDDYDGRCQPGDPGAGRNAPDTESRSTTNLTVTDKWGNVVEYTLTIEQIGGSGMIVPHRGFLLNNELTDFDAVYADDDPNNIQGGKRPRSSMSPTIVLRDGKPFVALGTPGGSTIITTVAQMLLNRIDRGMTIEQALREPRASQRNTEDVTAEPAFIREYGDALRRYGHSFEEAPYPNAEIGAATAIEVGPHGLLTAVSEPTRRGGGSALVVRPAP